MEKYKASRLGTPAVVPDSDAWVLERVAEQLHWRRLSTPKNTRFAYASRAFHTMYELPFERLPVSQGDDLDAPLMPLMVIFGGCSVNAESYTSHQCDNPVENTTITYLGSLNSSSGTILKSGGVWRSIGKWQPDSGPSPRFGAAMSCLKTSGEEIRVSQLSQCSHTIRRMYNEGLRPFE